MHDGHQVAQDRSCLPDNYGMQMRHNHKEVQQRAMTRRDGSNMLYRGVIQISLVEKRQISPDVSHIH